MAAEIKASTKHKDNSRAVFFYAFQLLIFFKFIV